MTSLVSEYAFTVPNGSPVETKSLENCLSYIALITVLTIYPPMNFDQQHATTMIGIMNSAGNLV